MKYIIAFVFLAFIAVASQANAMHLMSQQSEVPQKCDFQCPKLDVPVCAKNGQCMQLFLSQCTLSAYNCKHPQKPFQIIEDYRCEQGGAPLCNWDDVSELGLEMTM